MDFYGCSLELGISQFTHHSCESDEPNTIPSQTFDDSAQDKDGDFQDIEISEGFPWKKKAIIPVGATIMITVPIISTPKAAIKENRRLGALSAR
jgi:hypothetical protein